MNFAIFASPAQKSKNAKFSVLFRASFVRNPRKTQRQARSDRRASGRILRHVNGAPHERTQKQNPNSR
jgi:hypothetical protein